MESDRGGEDGAIDASASGVTQRGLITFALLCLLVGLISVALIVTGAGDDAALVFAGVVFAGFGGWGLATGQAPSDRGEPGSLQELVRRTTRFKAGVCTVFGLSLILVVLLQ